MGRSGRWFHILARGLFGRMLLRLFCLIELLVRDGEQLRGRLAIRGKRLGPIFFDFQLVAERVPQQKRIRLRFVELELLQRLNSVLQLLLLLFQVLTLFTARLDLCQDGIDPL